MEFLRENGNSRVKKLECNIVVRPRRLIFYCVINSILFLEFCYASRIFEISEVNACSWSSCSFCILIHFKLRRTQFPFSNLIAPTRFLSFIFLYFISSFSKFSIKISTTLSIWFSLPLLEYENLINYLILLSN